MIEHRILISGPVGSGKTTAVHSLSSKRAVSTEENSTEFNTARKHTTTVAMDYGVFDAGAERMHLYGTPGQERFKFMWEILGSSACGLVLLIDNSRDEPLHDLANYVNMFKVFSERNQIVVGVTCMDLAQSSAPSIQDYKDHLRSLGYFFPVCEVDARKGDDVLNVIYELIDVINEQKFGKKAICF